MDISKMLAQAMQERARVEEAIAALERLRRAQESLVSARQAAAQQGTTVSATAAAVPPPPTTAPVPSIAPLSPPPQAPNPVQVAPPPTPVPVKRVVQAGTALSVRLIDSLDSARNKVGDTFRATLKVPLAVDGNVVIPAGADVEGRVVDASNAGRFTGHSELNLELIKLTSNDTVYPIQTQGYDRSGDARGKGTAETVGGGAVLGAIIGAIAGGGKGAAVGTVAGAGAGGATRGRQERKADYVPVGVRPDLQTSGTANRSNHKMIGRRRAANQRPRNATRTGICTGCVMPRKKSQAGTRARSESCRSRQEQAHIRVVKAGGCRLLMPSSRDC